jgi:hypothetical protein
VRSRDADVRLAERALRECWPVPAERRAELVAVLVRLAADERAGARERISAIKALLDASRINLAAVAAAVQAEELETLQARLEALEGRADELELGSA